MVGNISQSSGGGLQELLRSMRKEQDEAPGVDMSEALTAQAANAVSVQTMPANVTSSNIMSRNFASAEREESKYIMARKAGQGAVNKQANRQMAILNAALAELNSLSEKDANNYATRSLIGRKAARRMQEERQQAVREESERNLEEIKDKIEEKAQEAAMPKDENGKPMEGLPTESTREAAPMPEISDSNLAPAPAPEVTATPAPVPTPKVAAPAAPSTPFINITV